MVWLFLWNPGEFNMLGANGSFSAKVFFCSKTLALRKSAALLCGAPFRAASFLSTHDRISKRYRCRRLNAYGIKRFRAFFARKFTDYSIDAKRLILGIAQI